MNILEEYELLNIFQKMAAGSVLLE